MPTNADRMIRRQDASVFLFHEWNRKMFTKNWQEQDPNTTQRAPASRRGLTRREAGDTAEPARSSEHLGRNSILFASGLCCKNTPEFDDLFGFSVEDVEEEVIRGRKLVCHKCKKRGATAGCEVRRCKKSYHYPCALEDGAVMVEDADKGMFGLYCLQHSQKNKENGSPRNGCSSAAFPETSNPRSEAGSSKKRPSQSASPSPVLPAKRILEDLKRIVQESSNPGGNECEDDSSMFAPLESDIDEDSQVPEQETGAFSSILSEPNVPAGTIKPVIFVECPPSSPIEASLCRKTTEDLKESAGSDCKRVRADEASLLPAEKMDVGTRSSVIVSKEATAAVNENEPSPERSSVHSPLPQTSAGSSPVPDPMEAPRAVPAPADASDGSPAAPEPSIDSASFWKSCNEAGCTKAIFTGFIREMNDIGDRIQSAQASQEDYDLALSVMQASGKMANMVTKQNEEMQQKRMELDKAAASMRKVLSALKR